MDTSNKTYTYRCGEKIELEKSPDEMVVRTLPDTLAPTGAVETQQVSSASTRVRTGPAELEAMMARSRGLAPTHHAYYETDTGKEFLITDRIFVSFEEALTERQVDEFAGRYGLLKRAVYGDRDYLFQLTDHTGMNPVKLVVKLTEQEPLVAAAEHDLNQRLSTYQFSPPLDPEYQRQWHLHTGLNHPDYNIRACSRCEDAWRLLDQPGSEEVVIAISDDGCKLDHRDFDSPGKFADWGYLRGERLITANDIDADPAQMYQTGSNHGTSCAGVVAGEIDAVLSVGAAPGCRLLPIQWQSSGPSLFISDSKLLTVLDYIADKADVMSNSWGGVPISLWARPVVERIRELAQHGGRRGKGIVFLWAAGNDNCPIDHTAPVDVPYTGGVEVRGGAPVWVGVRTARRFRNNLVGIPGLMHIAALASTARRSHYSNYGTGISLCAPTNNVHTYHRMSVRGLGVTTTTGEPVEVTHRFGGTSSATPLVAGIAGLVISANPGLSALEVISILERTASRDLDFSGYARTPPANFDPDTSWDVSPIAPFDSGAFVDNGADEGTWSPWFGFGRVDAQAAVAEALGRLQPGGARAFHGASSPDRSIPDDNPRGIRDRINCAGNFTVGAVRVGVDIPHTYIGDLRVTLISPAGTPVVLHNRAGGGANDLRATFDARNTPGLLALAGQRATGDWTLHVQDLAPADRGRLSSWSLDINGEEDTWITVEEFPGVIIPDNVQPGIQRSLAVPGVGRLDDIRVALDISHTYIGDLVVELVSPDQTPVLLHNRSGGSSDNLIRTYTMTDTAALQRLRGGSIQGDWTLKVSDHAGADRGKLNHWGLKLRTTP